MKPRRLFHVLVVGGALAAATRNARADQPVPPEEPVPLEESVPAETPTAPSVATPAARPEPPPAAAPAKKPSPPIGLRIDAGYSRRKLLTLPLSGADMGLAIGGEPRRNLVLWGAARLFLGSTENGLHVYTARLGVDIDWVLDRFRIGVGTGLFLVGIKRAVRDETIRSWGPAVAANARVDIIRADGFAIFGRVAIDAGYELFEETLYWGPSFGAGVDFDLAGRREPAPRSGL